MKHTAGVITISDMGAKGERIDTSGPTLCHILKEYDWDVVYQTIIPDEKELIKKELLNCCDKQKINLVLTTGGTGFSPRDITPEATLEVIQKNAFGISEVMRAESMKITKKACLSRGVAGIRNETLIINLPGSEKAVKENIMVVLDVLHHGVDMILSGGSANCGG